MLSKEDLKELQKLLNEHDKNLLGDLDEKFNSLESRLDEIDSTLSAIRLRVMEVSSRQDNITREIRKIRKDIDAIINVFDNEYLKMVKRVGRIEEHLNLPEYFD